MEARYISNHNGTITDSVTGLMWQTGYSYPESGNYLTWKDAKEYIDKLNQVKLGGFDDWRLPSRLEIQSIYEMNYAFESGGKRYILHMDPLFEFSYGSCYWTTKTRLSAALGFEFDVGAIYWYPQSSESGSARGVRLHMDSNKKLLTYFNDRK